MVDVSNMIPVGFGQDDSFASAVNLPSVGVNQGNSPPTNARVALIQVTGAGLYWSDDSDTAPTTSNGMYLAAGDSFLYVGDPLNIKIIEENTNSVVRVSYYA